MIIDEVNITIEAGAGGNGCLSFRREKYVPRGGPDGGNGGRGGDIFLEARNDVHTLVDFIYHPLFRAKHGGHGKGKNKHGREAQPITIRVPVGTLVKDENKKLILDMKRDGLKCLIAKGGRGGRGNTTFTTSTLHAPRLAEKGEPGEKKALHLELKLLADVGIVGFPNAGKSTLLSRVSAAHPKIADYPFTTLEPQLGVVRLSDGRSFVLADVPGLIEGASQGKGLGIRFLKHLERTRVLLHLVELATIADYTELEKRIKIILLELKKHNRNFQKIPQLLVFTKLDAVSSQPVSDWVKKLEKKGLSVCLISAVTGRGLDMLLEKIWKLLSSPVLESTDAISDPAKIIYRAKTRFLVKKIDGVFHITGPEVRKWVSMTNFENPAALERLQKILRRMGILNELKKMGIRDGNLIILENEKMIFEAEQLGAFREN